MKYFKTYLGFGKSIYWYLQKKKKKLKKKLKKKIKFKQVLKFTNPF
jgi:hypothetical protein